MRVDAPQVHGDVRRYLRSEYDANDVAVIATTLRAHRTARPKANASTFRTVLRTLAGIPETLAAALTGPGGT